ncbi:MAG: conjugal transfer protein TraG [gamma proteobacterium symbiont of Clathrolucina costata]
MEFTIYSIGDSAFLEQVLIALAMITGVDDISAMVQVGMAVGVFATILSAIAKGGREIEFQHILIGYILWATMFVPTARVLIEDTYTGDVRVVDNVPMGPAAAGGIISLVGYKVTELFEVAYGPIIPKVTETEFAESLRLLTDIRSKASESAVWRGLNSDAGGGFVDLRRSWTNYIKDCTLKKVDLGMMSPEALTTGQYQASLQFTSSLFGTRIYTLPGDANGADFTCTDAWTELNNVTNFGAETVNAFNAVLGLDSNNLGIGETSQTKTQNALDALLAGGITAQSYMEVAVLEPILMQAASGKYEQLQDLNGSLMINQAIQQRNATWAAEQTMFMTIVRPMLAFFESFTYAIAPIMAFVIVLGAKGVQLAGKYFTLLIWIQLWMPLLSIVNLYIYTAASRKMDAYTAMAGHNWDSFYALNSAADTMQNWIATGGLLASATPALALMLIYGSAVTATHLAQRLKSSDVIDEGYQSPSLKDNAPLASVSPMYSGDTVSGLMLTGAQGAMGTATVSSVLSNLRQSGNTVQNTESEQFSSDLARSINSSQTASELFSKASVAGASMSSGNSTISQNSLAHARSFMDQHGIDHSHSDAIAGMAGLSASLGANLDVDKAAGFMSDKFGVARAAAKQFLQDAGVKGAPGNSLVPVNDASGDGDSLLNINAGAMANAHSQSRTTDESKTNYGQNTSAGSDYKYSSQEQAQFNQELSSQISRQDAKSFQNNWGTSDASSIRSSASELVAATQTYQTASGLQSTLGAASSMQMRTIGALAAGRDQEDMAGNPAAQQLLDAGWTSQPSSVKAHAEDLYNRYASWGMPHDVARNTARLTALTDPNNFKENPSGHLSATMLAADVIRQATGLGGSGRDFNYDQNSALDKPSFTSGDIRDQAGGLSTPNTAPISEIKDTTQQPVNTAYSERDQLQTNALNGDHSSNVSGIQASGRQSEQGLIGQNEAQYRNQVLNPPEMSTAASMWGAYDNTSGWIGRRAEQVAGGTEAFLKEFGGGMGEAYDAYKNLSPQQADQFRSAIQQQDDALFDSLGIAGLPVKGAQIVGNHIIGAAVAGYDAAREWFNNGSDLSQAAQGMSIQEKGAFFAAAAGEAAHQGGEAFSAFMNQYGAEFKQTMEQVGQHQYGLTPKQAAIFAESYDTNNEAMSQKVQSFKEDYAILDENGKPVWDTTNGEWSMTPENKEFTDAVVNRITAATSAGDRVGSYLTPVSGYNVATRSVTPGGSH